MAVKLLVVNATVLAASPRSLKKRYWTMAASLLAESMVIDELPLSVKLAIPLVISVSGDLVIIPAKEI